MLGLFTQAQKQNIVNLPIVHVSETSRPRQVLDKFDWDTVPQRIASKLRAMNYQS